MLIKQLAESYTLNIVAKGEIARFEQFLFLSQFVQKSSAADASECVCMWERVKFIIDVIDNPPQNNNECWLNSLQKATR